MRQFMCEVLAIGLFWVALITALLVGIERQDRALEIDLPPAPERSHLQPRDEHPHNVWRRWCPDGENWHPGRQECV